MTESQELNYGPLAGLIGTWKGDKGLDIAPEPDGEENNPFYETIVYSPMGDVTNAESQDLMAVHYRQIVQRKSNDKVFHDQTGYWIWDAESQVIMHAFSIPRGVCVLAGGTYDQSKDVDGDIIFEVSATLGDSKWGIQQSPFMAEKASTESFEQILKIGNGTLSYSQTTMVQIYGRRFEHTDNNELVLV